MGKSMVSFPVFFPESIDVGLYHFIEINLKYKLLGGELPTNPE